MLNLVETKKFYDNYNKICNCVYCRNYLKFIEDKTKLKNKLLEYNININKPIEVIDYSWNEDKRVIDVYYLLLGKIESIEKIEYAGVEIEFVSADELYEIKEIKEDYYFMKLNMSIDWVLSETIID